MSWCEATPQTPSAIELAQFLRRRHVPVRTWRGKRCAHCGFAWRRHGCRQYLWATDYLSRLSRIVLFDRPSRPKCGRHRPSYTEKLRDYAAVAEEHITTQTRLRQQRRAGRRHVTSPAANARAGQRRAAHHRAPATAQHVMASTRMRDETFSPVSRQTPAAAASASVPARTGASAPVPRPTPHPGALSARHAGRRPLGSSAARDARSEVPAPIPRPDAVSMPHPGRRELGPEAARNARTEAPVSAPVFAARNRSQNPPARFAQAVVPAPMPEPISTPVPRSSPGGGAAVPGRVDGPVSWQLYP